MTFREQLPRLVAFLLFGTLLIVSVRLVVSGYQNDLTPTAAVVDEIFQTLVPRIRTELHSEFIARAKADSTYERLLSLNGPQLEKPEYVIQLPTMSHGTTSPGYLGGRFEQVEWDVEMWAPSTTDPVNLYGKNSPYQPVIKVSIRLSQSWKSSLRSFPGHLEIIDKGAPPNRRLLEPLEDDLAEKRVPFVVSSD